MLTYDNITNTVYNGLVIAYNDLHKQLNDINVTKYKYLGNGKFYPPNLPKQGGIYIMFDKTETFNRYSRVVRVGKAEKSLLTRLTQHFINLDKDHSILRKHIGRSLLHKWEEENNVTYESAVQDWNTKGVGNPELEEKVTEYLIDNISFCLIPLTDKKQIRKLEQTLLEILSIHNRLHHETTGKYIQTDNWLGNYCKENQRVMESGMWNDEHIRNWKK